MRTFVAILVLLLTSPVDGQVMPHVLTPELRAKWPAMAKAGNKFATYGTYRLAGAQNPVWFKNRSVVECLTAHMETGPRGGVAGKTYLELACDDYHLPPDVTELDTDGNPLVWKEHHDIWHALDYLLVREHRTPASDAEWKRRLKLRAEQVIRNIRIGDFDRCCPDTIGFLAILDHHIGTTYMQRPQLPPVVEWVNHVMEARFRQGGPRDASSAYEPSTFTRVCWVSAMVSKDVFPWFDSWAKGYAEWLPKSVSGDYRVAVAWGDQGDDNGTKLSPNATVPICFMLSGLGYDPDGALISLARKLIGDMTEGLPGYACSGAQFVCDPERIMSAPDVPLKDGIFVADGIGTTVLREGPRYVQAHMSRSRLADGTVIPWEDHHYTGAKDHFSWWENDVWIIPQPYGYGIEGNEFHANNAWCMKNDGWGWSQFFAGTTVTTDGFWTEGDTRGPWQRFHHAILPHRWTLASAFDKCIVKSRIEFNRTARGKLTVLTTWTSPGNTFPDWTTELPVLQRCQFALSPIKHEQGLLTWMAGDREVRCTYKMLDAAGVAVKPNIVLGQPFYKNSQNYWRAFIQSPKDLLNGSLELQIEPSEEPVFEIPTPEEDIEGGLILDDGQAHIRGEWAFYSPTGYGGNLHYTLGSEWKSVEWPYEVTPGIYRVAATWPEYDNRATNAAYSVTGGAQALSVKVNQKLAPASFQASEVRWQTLGEVAAPTGKLTVKLWAKDADGYVIADAVRIERIGDLPEPAPPPPDTDIPVRGVIRGKQLIIELP